jgi:hypothetical protein
MLDELASACNCTDCDSTLTDTQCQMVFDTAAGRRRVYECSCGAVIITVSESTTGA